MAGANVADSLADHFTRAWDMLIDAVGRFPAEDWRRPQAERMQAARIVYHVLMGADRYTWLAPAGDYLSKRQFSLDWVKAPIEQFPSREEAVIHLQQAKARTLAWISHFGPAGLVTEAPLWPWTGSCALAQGLYHLRHLQHHMAELSLELQRQGLPPVEWR